MRILVTGIAGFAGSHLANFLVNEEDVELHGVIHRHERRIQHLQGKLELHRGDLRNALWVSELVQQVQPTHLVHLAAWSDVGGSWHQPWTTYELNIQCQLNLLEAVRRWQAECRTLIITSNEVYGLVQLDDLPIGESVPFRPNNPYGVSKIAQDMMALQYWHSHRLPTIRVRSFNHIGPDQADDFVASAFARQIAEIEAGIRPPTVAVGNLDAERDFTDVRDIVRAYMLLLQKGQPGAVYNVGSGQHHSVAYILERLLALSSADVSVTIDPARLRPSDVPMSICDNTRLVHTTGWQPTIPLEQSLTDLLNYWRMQLAKK